MPSAALAVPAGPPAGAVHAAVPFAVADIPGDVYPADFHLVDKRKQEVAGKVCSQSAAVTSRYRSRTSCTV